MKLFRRRYLALLIGTLPMLGTAAQPAGLASAGDAKGDPLLRYQWHISNEGQAVIGDRRPVSGVDMDVDLLHALGIRGRGVRVGVVDNGLEIGHEDLRDNIIPDGSHNFGNGSHDPTPNDPNFGHGTSVAGIIAAVGWNGRGGRGVAPEALLAGFDFLGSDSAGSDAEVRYSWGDGPEARTIDIFNNSWGSAQASYPDFPLEERQAWEALMRSTRGGLGGI